MKNIKYLGKKAYGEIFKSHELIDTKNEVVIRTLMINMDLFKNNESLISLEREVMLLKNCDHPNILKYFDSFRKNDGECVIVTEFANLGSLKDYFDMKGEWKNRRLTDEEKQ